MTARKPRRMKPTGAWGVILMPENECVSVKFSREAALAVAHRKDRIARVKITELPRKPRL